MPLRHKFIVVYLLSSFYHFSFGQNISVLSDVPFQSIHNINRIYHSTVLHETVFVFADIRDESGFIDVLLLKMNKEGDVKKEITIGSANSSERPIGIFEI